MGSNKVGLVGLGRMGSSLLERLQLETHVIAYDSDLSRAQTLASENVQIALSLEDFRACEYVILCLPSVAASEGVLQELGSYLDNARIFETSTVPPEYLRTISGRLGDRIELFDTAILAGVEAMQAGKAKLLVGNATRLRESDREVLNWFSESFSTFDELGGGMAAKIINNAVAHANMSVLLEARAMAVAHGITDAELFRVLDDADSGVYRPYEFRLKERVANRDFDGGMSVSMALKDSLHAIEVATSVGVPLFSIGAAHQVYQLAVSDGLGDLDYASISLLWPERG
ncbi:NAD(P)-dependent oxidoreductase [Nesterenkonia ebinurensis]|uniref:NAD(P)-dependent oxidoreductase n=1 Tax=Nesterenkonia ebinurensis TaxID=2608252 RepID=UPI00123E2DE7|nr:NAD-binding protein [Nesterenkonia ebinurensis]